MYYHIALTVYESVILHINQDHIFSFDIKEEKKKRKKKVTCHCCSCHYTSISFANTSDVL